MLHYLQNLFQALDFSSLADAALRAAAVGVWLHGRAGDLAEQELTAYSVTPEDVVRKLPDAIREILE